jgi:hypothetical protein
LSILTKFSETRFKKDCASFIRGGIGFSARI